MADFGGMSAAQINASMGFGPGGVGDQSQALLNSNFGNFGQQTDYYSGLGAAYGRATGGFGGTPGAPGGGGIDPNDPADIARYWQLMSGGSDAYNHSIPYNPPAPAPPPGIPSPMPQPLGTAMPQINQNDPNLIAEYYRLMGKPNPNVFNTGTSGVDPYASMGDPTRYIPTIPGAGDGLPPFYNPWGVFGYPGYGTDGPNSFGRGATPVMPSPQLPSPPPTNMSYLPGGGLNPNDPGNIAAYYRLMGGGAMPAAMNPASSLDYLQPSLPSGDRAIDQTPQSVLGHPGTLDQNVMDPSQIGTGSRNAITQAMLQQGGGYYGGG